MKLTATELALLNLADRAEKSQLRHEEANALRAGINELANKHREARAAVGGLESRLRELRQKVAQDARERGLADPWRVPCPYCRAPTGERCKAVRGMQPPRTPHTARLDAVRKEAQ